jgi:hypothetical protein
MSVETRANAERLDGDLAEVLERNREALIRRWLMLVVERSSLEELAAAPLSRRVEDLDLLLEAAGAGVADPPAGEPTERPCTGLRGELDSQLDAHHRSGQPFSVAILADPGADRDSWSAALHEALGEEGSVLEAGDGATAVVLPGHAAPWARHAVDRARVSAWDALGGEGGLADAGIATCPDDGTSPHELLAVAHERLGRVPEPEAEAPPESPEPSRGRLARLIEAQTGDAVAAAAEITPLRRA